MAAPLPQLIFVSLLFLSEILFETGMNKKPTSALTKKRHTVARIDEWGDSKKQSNSALQTNTVYNHS